MEPALTTEHQCAIVLWTWYNAHMRPFRTHHRLVSSCTYHVVWCAKYRRPVLGQGVDRRLKAILHEVAHTCRSELLELAVLPDHVQLVAQVDPQFGIHRLIKRMKGRSSHLLREEYPSLRSRLPSLWTNHYFVATVGGGAPRAIIKQYIEQQKHA